MIVLKTASIKRTVVTAIVIVIAFHIGARKGRGEEVENELSYNCIDSCILEFARLAGRPISHQDLEAAIQTAGLEPAAAFRNLADCQKILRCLKVPTEAIRLRIDSNTRYPEVAIVYLPPSSQGEVGHVIVVSTDDSLALRVYDPAAEAKVVNINNSNLSTTLGTIAIVPAGTSRRNALRATGVTVAASSIFGGGLVFLLLVARRWKRTGSQSSDLLSVLLLAVPALLSACGPVGTGHTLPVVIGETEYDFGVISKERISEVLKHTFSLRNISDDPVVISALAVSCGCVVAEGKQGEVVIQSGETFSLPVSIDVSKKYGPFHETILLRFQNRRLPPQKLSLRGLIQGMTATTSTVQLGFVSDERSAGEVVVSCVRPVDERAAVLLDYKIEVTNAINGVTSQSNSFNIDSPRYQQAPAGVGVVTDVWRFPVTHLRTTHDQLPARGKLTISWDHPAATKTIDIVVEKPPSIELLTSKIHLPPIVMGSTYTEEIPLRINDSIRASQSKITSDSSSVQASIDIKTKRLVIAVRPTALGNFLCLVNLTLDTNTHVPLEIRGTATQSE